VTDSRKETEDSILIMFQETFLSLYAANSFYNAAKTFFSKAV